MKQRGLIRHRVTREAVMQWLLRIRADVRALHDLARKHRDSSLAEPGDENEREFLMQELTAVALLIDAFASSIAARLDRAPGN